MRHKKFLKSYYNLRKDGRSHLRLSGNYSLEKEPRKSGFCMGLRVNLVERLWNLWKTTVPQRITKDMQLPWLCKLLDIHVWLTSHNTIIYYGDNDNPCKCLGTIVEHRLLLSPDFKNLEKFIRGLKFQDRPGGINFEQASASRLQSWLGGYKFWASFSFRVAGWKRRYKFCTSFSFKASELARGINFGLASASRLQSWLGGI